MLRSKFDVTHLIKKSGKNAVAVLITDPDQKKTRKGKDPYGVACSPSYLAGAGWDWMPYVPGWDTHGLPTELKARKKAGIGNSAEISVVELRKMCEEFVNLFIFPILKCNRLAFR